MYAALGTIAKAGLVLWFIEKFGVVVDPLLPGSEQFSLQHRRASETLGAPAVDLAFWQQSGILPCAEV